MKGRPYYIISAMTIILLGLWSRHGGGAPAWIGDMLYATMMYLLVKIATPKASARTAFIAGLLICFAIEFSQLYHAPWINVLRRTTFGKLVLGQGFLWSDLAAYFAGTAIAVVGDLFLFGAKTKG